MIYKKMSWISLDKKVNDIKEYHRNTQNLKFEEVVHTNYKDALTEMIQYRKLFSHHTQKLEKDVLKLLERGGIDIFFGLYTKYDNCSYKIFLTKYNIKDDPKKDIKEVPRQLIMSGSLFKDKLTFILPILIICIPYNNIEIVVTEETYLLFSIIDNPIRKYIAYNTQKIENFLYEGGILTIINNDNDDNDDKDKKDTYKNMHNTFPIFNNYGIYTKIDSMYKDNEYKEKYGFNFSTEDKKMIMTDFETLNYFIDKKIENKNN